MQIICYKKIAIFLVKDMEFFYHLDKGVGNLNSYNVWSEYLYKYTEFS